MFAFRTVNFSFGPVGIVNANPKGRQIIFCILSLSENVTHTLSGNIYHQPPIIATLVYQENDSWVHSITGLYEFRHSYIKRH